MMQPSIHDNGIGFDLGAVVIATDPRTRPGLTRMKSRAELYEGCGDV
jgi:signal transduction histidine kinase